ncbi:unnamed protein product [Effrenium voratum]|nr:unnamed protein product [Effrenium voratum]
MRSMQQYQLKSGRMLWAFSKFGAQRLNSTSFSGKNHQTLCRVCWATGIGLLCSRKRSVCMAEHASKGQVLEAEFQRIAEGTSGTVGIAVSLLSQEKTELTGLRTHELFPMASTFKVPLACVVMRMVDSGDLQLNDELELTLSDVRPGTGVLTMRLLKDQDTSPSHRYTVQQLLEMAMNDSDNAATDVLLKRVGGPRAVTQYIRSLGLQKLTVARGCLEHLRDRCGVSADKTPAAALLCQDHAPIPEAQLGGKPQSDGSFNVEMFTENFGSMAYPTHSSTFRGARHGGLCRHVGRAHGGAAFG